MTELTLEPGVLRVASAFPDPPFEVTIDGTQTGFDVELMRLICEDLGLARHQVEYAGDDFNGIFDGLTDGGYDALISGTTITPEREQVALFSDPYLEFDQGLVVNVTLTRRSKPSTICRVESWAFKSETPQTLWPGSCWPRVLSRISNIIPTMISSPRWAICPPDT
jgi:membrane-bound lytic murein transglycosylase MltF